MLLKSKIASFAPYSPEWYSSRLGRLTGSKIGCLMASKGIGDGGMTYIRNKVGELFTKKSSDREIDTAAIQWGRDNEPIALQEFKNVYKIPLDLMIKCSTIIEDNIFSVTPDALIPKSETLVESTDKLAWHVEPIEVKCLPVYANHLELVECQTPKDLLDCSPLKFWQVISQMQFTNSLRGHFVAFHPHFKNRLRIHHILFKKIELSDYIKTFNQRILQATTIYNEKKAFYETKNIPI